MNKKGIQLFAKILLNQPAKNFSKNYQRLMRIHQFSQFNQYNYRLFSTGRASTINQDKEAKPHPGIITKPQTEEQKAKYNADKAANTQNFESLKDEGASTKDTAAKNLSIALMNSETPEQCLNLFENDYLRQHREKVYGEELCLILYFMTKNIQNINPEDAYKLVQSDLRFNSLVDMLYSRLEEIDFQYIVTTIWALGICVSGYQLKLHPDQKIRLVEILNEHKIDSSLYNNIPALTFSIACLMTEDLNEYAQQTIQKFAKLYVDNLIERMDLLQASTLLMGLGRSYVNDSYILDKIANEIINKHKQKLFYEEGAIGEVVNMIISLSDLHYRNDKIFDILQGYVMKMKKYLNIYTTSLLANSYATIMPERIELFNDLAPELHEKLHKGILPETYKDGVLLKNPQIVEELIPDLTTYNNLWLSITCFGIKSNAVLNQNAEDKPEIGEDPQVKARGYIRLIAKDLIKIFNGNKRWRAQDINIAEASNISIAIASLKLENEKFIADVGDIIRANIKEASNFDLMNLAKSSHYLRNFKHTKDIYSHVHAECVTRYNLKQLQPEETDTLSRIFTSQGSLSDSPFINTRIVR